MLRDEHLQLADHRRVPTQREIGVDPVLDGRQPQLRETFHLRPQGRHVRDVAPGHAMPQRQRLTQLRRRLAMVAPQQVVTFPGEPFETTRVQSVGHGVQHVAGALGHDHVIAEDLAKS